MNSYFREVFASVPNGLLDFEAPHAVLPPPHSIPVRSFSVLVPALESNPT